MNSYSFYSALSPLPTNWQPRRRYLKQTPVS